MAADASLVGFGKSTNATITTSAGSVSAGDTLVFIVSHDPGTTISSVSVTGSGSDSFGAARSAGTGQGKLAAYVIENATGGGSVTATVNFSGNAFGCAHLIKCTGVAASSFDSASLVAANDNTTPYTATSGTFAQANNIVLAAVENNWGTTGAYASSNFTLVSSEPDVATYWTSAVAKLYRTSTTTVTPSFTRTNDVSNTSRVLVFGIKESGGGGGAPTLTSATPSGTLGTNNSATLGATTDSATGTFYGVVDVAANISGITATQVKAGQNNAGAAPVGSGNSSVSNTSPSVIISGLTSNTLYSYAVVQNNGSDSNVLTGTFTTAAVVSRDISKYGPKGFAQTLLTM